MRKTKKSSRKSLRDRFKTAVCAVLSLALCLTLSGGGIEAFASQPDTAAGCEECEIVAEAVDEVIPDTVPEYAAAANETDETFDATADIQDDAGIMTLDIDPDNLPNSVTVLPSDTTVPPSDAKILFKNAAVELSDELIEEGAWIYTSDNIIYPYIPIKEEGASYEDPLTITAKEAAVIDGRSIDVELRFTNLTYGALSSASVTNIANYDVEYVSFMHTNSSGLLRLAGLDYYWADSSKTRKSYSSNTGMRIYPSGGTEVSYKLKITWSDTGETVDLPFYQVAYDLDMGIGSDLTNTEGYTFTGGIDGFYVYEGTRLQCIEQDEGIYFGATGNTDVTGEPSYKLAGVIAHSTDGTFSATCHVISACYNYFEIYSDYLNIGNPQKTVTSTGSNYDGSYAEGDEVVYEITQQMGEIYVDCFGEYNSLVITDIIPEGLSLKSYEMYSGGAKVGSGDGTGSYDEGTRTLTYSFSDSWIGDLSHYGGQELKLVVTCTLDSGFLGNSSDKTIRNTAYSYFSGLEYGPASADIKEEYEPGLSLEKKITNPQYNTLEGSLMEGDSFTYEIRVTQTEPNAVAENVVITDTLPGNDKGPLEILSITADNANVSLSGTTVTADCGNLSYGESATVYIRVRILWSYEEWEAYSPGETQIENYAYASADNAEDRGDSCGFSLGQAGNLRIRNTLTDPSGLYASGVSGFVFTLTGSSDSGTYINLTGSTDSEGVVEFTGVSPGTYTLTETNTPDGTGEGVPGWWDTEKSYTVTIENGKTTVIETENIYETGNVLVTKHVFPEGDFNNDSWTFTLEGTSDSGIEIKIDKSFSGEGTALFEDIPVGSYTITESFDSDDWESSAEVQSVSIRYSGTVSVSFTNTAAQGSLKVKKVIDDPGGLYSGSLSGFSFTLSGVSDIGAFVELTAVTGEDGTAEFIGVYPGSYILTETGTDGLDELMPWWDTAEPSQVSVQKDIESYAEAVNIFETGSVVLRKTVAGSDENGITPEGFAFRLEGVSDGGTEIDLFAVTDVDGIAEFNDIPTGTDYILTEVSFEEVQAAAEEGNPSAEESLELITKDLDEYLETYPVALDVGYGETPEIEFENVPVPVPEDEDEDGDGDTEEDEDEEPPVIYEPEPVAAEAKETEDSAPDETAAAKTGDCRAAAVWAVILSAAAAVLALMTKNRKKAK